MNKKLKKAIFGATCCAMSVAFLGLTACKDTKDPSNTVDPDKPHEYLDPTLPERRPLAIAMGEPDQNFNPFFYTSQNDGEIAGLTQISMLTTDENANPICGDNEPTVAKDYTIVSNDNGTTTYEFLIKNGIKFSDGTPLTIRDVLFNMYVYLDVQYAGSTTMYSVDIQGLKAYRAQEPVGDDSTTDFTKPFYDDADARITTLLSYDDGKTDLNGDIKNDIAVVNRLFREELTRDWNANAGTLSGYEAEYSFTEDWQVYFYTEGLIGLKFETLAGGGQQIKKHPVTGKNWTDLDEPDNNLTTVMTRAMTDEALIAQYMEDNSCTRERAVEYIMRDTAIDTVYYSYFRKGSAEILNPSAPESEQITLEMPYSSGKKLTNILTMWQTATNVREEFANEAKSAYYEGLGDDLRVKSISGITTHKTSTFNGVSLSDSHDVLRIVINGTDPAAIYNFGFSVAPMHYYSGTYEGVDYVSRAKGSNLEDGPTTGTSHRFGVKTGDLNFFNQVLKGGGKSNYPVGAGAYKCSDASNGAGSATTFYENKIAYYQRNDYFETVGSGISNAKIKYLRYVITTDDSMINALQSGAIDYGTPNCTPKNIEKVSEMEGFGNQSFYNNGYGYVGINPKYVPDVAVRRAIMMAMDQKMILEYYLNNAIEVFYPTSINSFVYELGDGKSWTRHYTIPYTTKKETIIDLITKNSDWKQNADGKFVKDGKTLKLTFTIAGGTDDHPAYDMFVEAAKFLNTCGFEVDVTTDITALQKLATGELAVWAAAWSSGVDPDMYQVWHKNSTASSVKNWGYDVILNDKNHKYDFENDIIEELSGVIEDARSTNNQKDRTAYYLDAYDLVMQLAVEMPTYQRKDLAVYNSKIIYVESLNQAASAYAGVLNRIWEVDYN